MNNWSFTGRLGGDAEMRSTAAGTMICSFSVAVESGWGNNKKTTWVRCAMFGDRGEKVCPHILKGDRIGVTGEAFLHSFEKRDGTTVSEINVRVNDVTLLSDAKKAEPRGPLGDNDVPDNYGTQQDQGQDGDTFVDDDIPF